MRRVLVAAVLLLAATAGYLGWAWLGASRGNGATASADSHGVVLSWTASTSSVAGYNVYRTSTCGKYGDGPLNGATLVTKTGYTDSKVTPGTYCYAVRSVVMSGGAPNAKQIESSNSNEVKVEVPSAVSASQ